MIVYESFWHMHSERDKKYVCEIESAKEYNTCIIYKFYICNEIERCILTRIKKPAWNMEDRMGNNLI